MDIFNTTQQKINNMVLKHEQQINDLEHLLECKQSLTPTMEFKKKEWVGLTDEEIEQGCKESWITEQAFQSAVWWAEAKLKDKNK